MTQGAPPQDLRSEEALLGAILISPGTVTKARLHQEVTGADFYRETNGEIWDAAVRCSGNGGCDPVAVAAELKRRGVDVQGHGVEGIDYLNLLASSVPAPGNARAYGERIKETAELRRIERCARATLEAVQREDKDGIARALDSLGQRVLYVDVNSGEAVETCPTCIENETKFEELNKKYVGLLSENARLRGEGEKKAKQHKYWDEIEAAHTWYCLAIGRDLQFTTDEFNQALSRWKQEAKGRRNPCKGALKAICGIAFDPTTTRGKNGKTRAYQDWDLLTRNQSKWEDFKARVPGDSDNDWWRCLIGLIEANFKDES